VGLLVIGPGRARYQNQGSDDGDGILIEQRLHRTHPERHQNQDEHNVDGTIDQRSEMHTEL
jgi:hypothetical protein